MKKEKKKSDFKFYATLIIVSGLIAGGAYSFNKYHQEIKYNLPPKMDNAAAWNENVKTDLNQLEVGAEIIIPEPVIEKLRQIALVEAKENQIDDFPDGSLTSQTTYSGTPLHQKYHLPLDLNKVFYGNLKPKDLSVFTGFNRVSKNPKNYVHENGYIDSKKFFKENVFFNLYFVDYYKKNKNLDWEQFNLDLVSEKDPFKIFKQFESSSNPHDLIVNELKQSIEVTNNSNTFYERAMLGSAIGTNYVFYHLGDIMNTYNLMSYFFALEPEINQYQYGPEKYNLINEMTEDSYWVTYAPTKVTKIKDNMILVDIAVDQPLTDHALSGITRGIAEYFGIPYIDYFNPDDYHVAVKISYEGLKDIPYINYGYYGAETLGSADAPAVMPLIPAKLDWFPNQAGQEFIIQYFNKMEATFNESKLVDPKEIIKEIATEMNVTEKEVTEVVLSYTFQMANYN